MERNLIVAIVLSMAVYVGWFALMDRSQPRPPIAGGVSQPSAVSPPSGAAPAAPPAAVAPAEPQPPVPLTAPNGKALLNPLGAALMSFRFEGPVEPVELVPQPGTGFFATWPELVFKQAPARWPHSAAFEAKHPSGFLVRKEFRFAPVGELSLLRVEFKNPDRKPMDVPAWELNLGPGLGTVAAEQKDNLSTMRAVGLYPPPPGRKQPRLEAIEKDSPVRDWQWLAVDNRYFMLAAFPARKEFSGYRLEFGPDGKTPGVRLTAEPERLAPGAASGHDIPFYLGPKAYTDLERMKLGFEKAVDFGWFDSVGRGLLKLLHWLFNRTGNYGWAIILLTILLQVVLFPLTVKALKAQAIQRKIQPEVAKLQQKYSKDPQRMQQELMALYKAKGANPMSGCFPMLLQIPVFVALFNALRNAWELHGSPWLGWVRDLSAHDPYYVLPILNGAVMYLQTRAQPMTVADPAQAKMMQFMPVIMTFMFLKFPSGLVLYWTTSALLNMTINLALRDRFAQEPAA